MAEPQPSSQPNEARGGEARTRSPSEPRSFDQAKGQSQTEAGRPSGQGANNGAEAARGIQTLAEGGRQMAEQTRRNGRQMADAWRQAVDPLLAMHYDLSQWFDDMFRQTFGFRTAPSANPLRPLTHLSAVSLLGLPPADLKETESAHLLAIELPGLTKDDVDVSILGDALVICGHKAEENEDASASYRVSERRFGRFERAFPLPPDVDRDRIEAQFRDGVLKVALPKNPQAAPPRSRIEIKG